jgi:AcrR family transcriptional regulator
MVQTGRTLRADAARNRARVLEVAYEAFANHGLSVSIEEIARRAGVGAGTVHRNFPSKESLVQAVIANRMGNIIASGHAFLDSAGPRSALFAFVKSMVLEWGADRGLVDALAGSGFDFDKSVPAAEVEFRLLRLEPTCRSRISPAPSQAPASCPTCRNRPARRDGVRGEGTRGRLSSCAELRPRLGRTGHPHRARRLATIVKIPTKQRLSRNVKVRDTARPAAVRLHRAVGSYWGAFQRGTDCSRRRIG